jgi:transcriptional regulator with GAF, ATPase, and Fis domain
MESKLGAADEIVGRSLAFQQVLDLVRMVANSDSVTLIQGETGTGKEVIARAIHDQSSRRQGPFVALNCAAIPGPLLESELFGHERGAFTGACAQTKGGFNSRMGVRSFSTRSAICRSSCNPNSSALCRSKSSSGWAAARPSA